MANPFVKKARWMLWALLLGACSQGRIVKVTSASEAAPYTAPKEARWLSADSLWAMRQDPLQARAALATYRRAAKSQAQVPELLTRLSRACYLVATFVERKPDRKESLYLEGAQAAEQALELHPGFHRVFQESGDEVEAVRSVDGPFLESAFWYAANLGRMANLEGAQVRIGNRDRLEAFIRRVLSKDEAMYYGGGYRFLAVMTLVLPHPDLDSARTYFDKSLRIAPLFFGTRVLMAEYLAVMEKNRALFHEQLLFVVQTPADTLPEAAAENRYEQAQARDLLADEARLF